MTHAHEWKPAPEFNRYVCDCGATGFRHSLREPIRPHKTPRDYSKAPMIPTGAERKGKRGPGGWGPGRNGWRS